jgi:hypothetical protein
LLQPRREHVSRCLGGLRSHWKVEMAQGESFLGFPRQFTVLFYTNKLNAVTTCEQGVSGPYNFAEGWYTWWCICRSDSGPDGTQLSKIEAVGTE